MSKKLVTPTGGTQKHSHWDDPEEKEVKIVSKQYEKCKKEENKLQKNTTARKEQLITEKGRNGGNGGNGDNGDNYDNGGQNHFDDCHNHCNEFTDCDLDWYNRALLQKESVLYVSAVSTPGLLYLDGTDWEGPLLKLLKAVARRVPWIRAVKIFEEADPTTTALTALQTGQVAVDVTPTALCVQNGVPQGTPGFGYLAIGRATQFNGTLVYVQSTSAPMLNCSCPAISAACTISTSTASNVLAMLASNTSLSFYANDNFVAMAAACGGYTGNIITLPTTSPSVPAVSNPATGASIVGFFNSFTTLPSVCTIVLYLDEVLTSSQIAEINAAGASAGYVFSYTTPTSSVLSYVWTFNDYASRLQLWFQFALDQVVASGEYNAIIKAGGLDGSGGSSGSGGSGGYNQSGSHQHGSHQHGSNQYGSNQHGCYQNSTTSPPVLPFKPPPVQYSIKKGFIPRAALYETLLPKLCCYEAKCPVKVLSTEECPEEVVPPPDNGS